MLVRAGRGQESLGLCRSELHASAEGDPWLSDLVVEAMQQHDLTAAGELAQLLAASRWGSRWHPPRTTGGGALAPPDRVPQAQLSLPKLQHDVEQFGYLRARGVLGREFDAVIGAYQDIAARMEPLGVNVRVPMTPQDESRIGHVYNRIIHVASGPRLAQALSPGWDRGNVQDRYLTGGPGLVVIDDFLTAEALASLQRFCRESTVWSGNRYADGRLGGFFFAGFNCPLLLQIAEEVRDALPQVISGRHPLRQLWGFKNSPTLPGDSTVHADFAAVNVNFWISPEWANLDAESGGLVVHDVAAPPSWDFGTYNESLDVIRRYLRERGAKALKIPYRQNRAIIFNSDLFHATSKIHWRSDYETRRVNITMLYGEREHDDHHPMSAAAVDLGNAGWPHTVPRPHTASAAWRSNAFGARRR